VIFPKTVLSITLLSNQDRHIAALKIEQGKLPQYLIFSISGAEPETEELAHNWQKLREIIQDSVLLIFDSQVLSQLNSLADLRLEYKELIEVRELVAIFYPLKDSSEPEKISSCLGIRLPKRFRSEAHKRVRIVWELITLCWQKGLQADFNYLNNLKEITKGLSCNFFFELLIKEQLRLYPDRLISSDPFFGFGDGNLFAAVKEEAGPNEIPERADWVEKCFAEDGLLAKKFPGYEHRAMQSEMAKAIIEGLNISTNLLIEAGTGTGKSIAYLLPSIWWSKKHEKKVVIATHTITLQEQLCRKDIPFLKEILPFDFKTALLKGKNNYICLRSFLQEKVTDDWPASKRFEYAVLFSWLKVTTSGDFSELSLKVQSPLWEKFRADNPACRPFKCQFAKRCFMLKARKRAEEADLVVINHSLLLANLKAENNILPAYENLIIDEAHNLYATALKQLGFEISYEQLERIFETLALGKNSSAFILKKNIPFWAEVYSTVNWTPGLAFLEQVPKLCTEALKQAEDFFRASESVLKGRSSLIFNSTKLEPDVYSTLTVSLENLTLKLEELNELLNKLIRELDLGFESLEEYKLEISKNKSDLSEIIAGLKTIIKNEHQSRVTYLERNNTLYLKSVDIEVAGILREEIFTTNNCTILTSATMTVGGQFDYLATELGITNYKTLNLDSPFDYERQMLFCVTKDFSPVQHSDSVLASKTASLIYEVAIAMQGRVLVLFTSYHYLRLVYSELLSLLKNSPLKALAQGINGQREELLREFRENDKTILLGTSSFWEGVDIPGESLSCLIMTKLPFWPPDLPIMEARSQHYKRKGLNPFRELHLPEAIIRFKQGLGRLIRTKKDRGVVILLDDRLLKKQYGKLFLKSFPVKKYYYINSEEVLRLIKGNF
jgi:ATP-dependent DNA helicase DinG